MDLGTLGGIISAALFAVGIIADFFRRAQRNQRAELRRTRTRELALRALAEDYDLYSYELERALRSALRGRKPPIPVKPRSLVEGHHDQPDELDDDPDPVEAGPGPGGGGEGGRHSHRGRGA